MRRLLPLLTLPALWAGAALGQTATLSTTFHSTQALREAAEGYVRAQLGTETETETETETDVVADRVDDRVRLPACASPLAATRTSSGSNARWTVALRCEGPQSWTLYVPVRITRFETVLVAVRNLPAGTTLSTADLRSERRDTALLTQGYVSAATSVVGQQLSRPVATGAALSPTAVARAAVVKRGETVTLVGRSNGFEVRAQGKALADAAVGDRVTVENSSSRRVVTGLVQADGVVEISL